MTNFIVHSSMGGDVFLGAADSIEHALPTKKDPGQYGLKDAGRDRLSERDKRKVDNHAVDNFMNTMAAAINKQFEVEKSKVIYSFRLFCDELKKHPERIDEYMKWIKNQNGVSLTWVAPWNIDDLR